MARVQRLQAQPAVRIDELATKHRRLAGAELEEAVPPVLDALGSNGEHRIARTVLGRHRVVRQIERRVGVLARARQPTSEPGDLVVERAPE